MNCKPGDLAVLIRGEKPEFIGRIVTVLRAYDGQTYKGLGPAWWCSTPHEQGQWHALDSSLRPIRGNPGADETLSWKDVPAPSIQQREGQGA